MCLVIFDLDGTLFNSETSVLPAVQEALEMVGLERAQDEFILSLMGENTHDFCTKLLSSFDDGLERYDEFIKALWTTEAKHIKINGELYAGVRSTLEKLYSSGYKLAICSNATSEYIKYVLETQGIKKYFLLIQSADDMEDKIDGVRKLLAYGKCSKAVMVGDRHHDLEAAKANEIMFIGATYGYGGHELKEEMYTVDAIDEIPELLGTSKDMRYSYNLPTGAM